MAYRWHYQLYAHLYLTTLENDFLYKKENDTLRRFIVPTLARPRLHRFPYNAPFVCKHWNNIASTSYRLCSVIHLQYYQLREHERPNWPRTLQAHSEGSGLLDVSLEIMCNYHEIAPFLESVNLCNVEKQRTRRIRLILNLLPSKAIGLSLHKGSTWLARGQLTACADLGLTSINST